MFSEEKKQKHSPTLQFAVGFGAGIGAGLAMFVLTLFLSGLFDRLEIRFLFRSSQSFAAVWGILSLALFAYLVVSTMEKRPSVFRAGVVAAFAVILLLQTACWNFSI